MTIPNEGPEALHAYRENIRRHEGEIRHAHDKRQSRIIEDQKLLGSYLRGELGQKLLDVLELRFDGDTFSTDALQMAYDAGARSVYLFLKDLKKENIDG